MAASAPFHRPIRIEAAYRRALDSLMREWVRLPNGANLDDIFHFLSGLGGDTIIANSERLARGMVTMTATENATSWREAARKSSQAGRIHDLLAREMAGPVGATMRGLVSTHATLIRSLPQRLAQDVAGQIATQQMKGVRAETIAADLRDRFPKITQSRIATLARTQVSSAAESITQARARNLGIQWYRWLTSEDSRTRISHRKLDLVLVSWSDPPAPEALVGEKSKLGSYNAGMAPNCRCTAAPIVDLDEVAWPAKVYARGSISRMNRRRFSEIYGVK